MVQSLQLIPNKESGSQLCPMLMAIFDTMSEENIPAQIQWLYDCRSAETSLFHYSLTRRMLDQHDVVPLFSK